MSTTDSRRRILAIVGTILALVCFFYAGFHAYGLAETAVVIGLPTIALALAYLLGTNYSRERTRRESVNNVQGKLAEREQVLMQRVHELSILHEIALAASAGVGVDQVLSNVTDAMRKTLPYEHLAVFLIEPHTGRLGAQAGYGAGYEAVKGAGVRLGVGITGHVAVTGEALIVADVRKDDRYVHYFDATRSELCVPLKLGERIIGVINVESEQLDAFGNTDLSFITTIANQLVLLIENARLFDEAQRWVAHLTALHTTSQAMIAQLDRAELLQTMARNAAELFSAPAASVFILDEGGAGRGAVVSYGLPADLGLQEHARTEALHNLARQSAGRPIRLTQDSLGSMGDDFSAAESQGLTGVLVMRLLTGDRLVGAIAVWDRDTQRVFSAQEQALAQIFAGQAVISLENARLYVEAQRADADLRRRVDELITLRQISLRLVSSLDLDTVLRAIAESSLRLVQATDVHIFLYDEATQTFFAGTSLCSSGQTLPPVMQPRPGGITAEAVRLRRPVVIQNASESRFYANTEAQSWGVRAIASFPLLRADAVIGAFNVAFTEPHAFSGDELRVLTLLADQAAIAVDNAKLHESLAEQAQRDSLTQVYNHSHLLGRLADAVRQAEHDTAILSFIMLDIDDFKEFNDSYGHAIGDAVLRSIVQAISSNVKRKDTVGRWGGEEFGIVLPGATTEQAEMVAQRIQTTVAGLELSNSRGERIPNPTVSQGIATFPVHGHTSEELIEAGDSALYRAKERGKDQIVIASTQGE